MTTVTNSNETVAEAETDIDDPWREPGFRRDDAEPDFDDLEEPVESSEDEEDIINDEDDEPDDEDIPLVDATENWR
jgi:hypothetical protein